MEPSTRWRRSWRADAAAAQLADRHYNRQNPGAPQFVPPGRCVVLAVDRAVWVTSWPFPEYVQHAWPGAWGEFVVSQRGRRALERPDTPSSGRHAGGLAGAAARHCDVRRDASKVRRKRDPGRSYRRAGWRHVGFTAAGLYVFQQLPAEMPAPDYSVTAPLLEAAG